MKRLHWSSALAYGILGVFLWLTVWEVISRSFVAFMPFAPSKAGQAFMEVMRDPYFVRNLIASVGWFCLSMGLALVIAVPIGLAIGYFAVLYNITYAPIQILRTISPLSLTPVAIYSAGIGGNVAIFLETYACIWPILFSTITGMLDVDRTWIAMARSNAPTRWRLFRYVMLPATLPKILQGLRLGMGITWIVAIAAEMNGVEAGLGYLIMQYRDVSEHEPMVVVILVIGILGLLTDLPLQYLQRRLR